MYFTHHFAHRETLTRAHSWLTQLGFNPRRIETDASGIPRIVVKVEPHRLGAVKMLINAAERTDPDGFPTFWDEARRPHSTPREYPEGVLSEHQKPHASVIGWHPLD
jgi:hypothetical protein